jgi:hypothetical protein
MRLVRLIGATTCEKQHEVWARLIEAEAKRLNLKAPRVPKRQAAAE